MADYNEMQGEDLDLVVPTLGPRNVPSPYRISQYVSDDRRILRRTEYTFDANVKSSGGCGCNSSFELAGPRSKIYFDPKKTRCGIVTCGGLCPGINDVVRSITLQMRYSYGVKTIYGFMYGYEGLVPDFGHEVVMLDPDKVRQIHQQGGTILGSSRGPQKPEDLVDALERLNINILFTIGGDGTMRGALTICEEIKKRGLKIAIVGIPKTIDNDIPFTQKTFGFETAYSIAANAIRNVHVEATGAVNGVGLLKLMGRHAGFIAAYAALACGDANFVLVPEVPFELVGNNGLLMNVYRRLKARSHTVVVVAEGAGQNLLDEENAGMGDTDPSGNVRLKDIGTYVRDRLSEYLKLMKLPHTIKYIDPSYLIRSAPATPSDSLFAGILGQNAAHAAMAGKTEMFVGYWNNRFTNVPIQAAVSNTKQLDPDGPFWQSVLESTGQPRTMSNCLDESNIDSDDLVMAGVC